MSDLEKSILLVEDNEDDVFLMKYALKQAKLSLPLQVASDGQEAVDYLGGTGKYCNRLAYPLPGIVFLDLKLPYRNGFEVFAWIRQQPPLSRLRVVILTSSPEPRDREKAQQLGAYAYLVKPPAPESLAAILRVSA